MVSIIGIVAVGIAAVFSFFFFRRAGEVGLGPAGSEVGAALGSIGTGIGKTGSGIALFGQGIGSGITGLFQPLTFFRDLLFGGEPIVNSPTADTVQATNSNNLGTSVIIPGSLTGGLI